MQKYSWEEPTERKEYEFFTFGQTICMMCEQYYRYCAMCLWVDTTKCIKVNKNV